MPYHTKNIAIVLGDMEYFNASICAGLYGELYNKGYKLCIYLTYENEEKEKEYIQQLIRHKGIDAMVIFSCMSRSDFYQEVLKDVKVPCVFVDRLLPYLMQADFVTVDNYGGANKIACLLIDKGAKNIACISMLGHNKLHSIEDRLNGFRDSHTHNPEVTCFREEVEYSEVLKSTEELLKKWEANHSFPDAVFAVNHIIMNAFISLVMKNKHWYKKTEHILLSCFDNIPCFDWIQKPIISAEQPIQDIVYYTASILRKHLEQTETKQAPSNIILPVRIIDRTLQKQS